MAIFKEIFGLVFIIIGIILGYTALQNDHTDAGIISRSVMAGCSLIAGAIIMSGNKEKE